MKHKMRVGLMIASTLLVSGCGTLVEGDGARIDHWGPIPVLCLGHCELLDPYYSEKQQDAESDPNAPEPTAETASAEQTANDTTRNRQLTTDTAQQPPPQPNLPPAAPQG